MAKMDRCYNDIKPIKKSVLWPDYEVLSLMLSVYYWMEKRQIFE